ncbi:MAG: biotin transporter BioY, partial [Oscillospiraceae bacterium]
MKTKTRSLVLMAFFAALVAVCSQIIIPLPYVPINLALFAVYLAGSLLGAKYGGISMLIFLALGFVGAPVFAGMQGGVGILFGKTGGYIIGYVFCAVLVGFLCKKKENSFWFLCLAFVAGLFVCY